MLMKLTPDPKVLEGSKILVVVHTKPGFLQINSNVENSSEAFFPTIKNSNSNPGTIRLRFMSENNGWI
jgi:hypothetical protein